MLRVNYNGATVFYLSMYKKYQFKAKDSEAKIKKHSLCLENILAYFSANIMKKKKKLKPKTKQGVCTIFMMIIGLLILVILPTFINI